MTIHLSSGSLGSRVRPKHDDTLEDTVLMRAFEPEVADVTLRPSACSNRPRSPLLLTGRSTTSTPCTSTAATTTGGAGPARSVGPDDLGHPTTRHQGPRRQQTTDPARAAMDRRHDRLKHLIGDLMWPTPAGPYTPDRFSTVISEPGPPPTHRLGRRHRPDPQTRHRGHAYYQRCLQRGKTKREATRALKRRISDRIWTHLQHTNPSPPLT